MSWADLLKIERNTRPKSWSGDTSRERTGCAPGLRDVVKRHGSVTAMATAIGRTEGALRKWLRGDSEPSATDLRRLSKATGVSVDWMIFGLENEFSTAQTLR